MNTRGGAGSNLGMWYFAYIVLGVLFFSLTFFWVSSYARGAALYEDFFAKEIVRVINAGTPGQEVYMDMTEATTIGFKNGLAPADIVRFNNELHTVTVRLSQRSSTSYAYFNRVSIRGDSGIEILSGNADTNRLHFFITDVGDLK